MVSKASLTLTPSLAETSKYGIGGWFVLHHVNARFCVTYHQYLLGELLNGLKRSRGKEHARHTRENDDTKSDDAKTREDVVQRGAGGMRQRAESTIRLFSSTSILLPTQIKAKFCGSLGLAWIKNSSFQLFRFSNDF